MISILLASYNGEHFIAEQIESLLSQTVQDFNLYICDDNSTDSTLSIVTEYANRFPDKIFVSVTDKNTGSPKHNFIKLMIAHKNEYVMLCDQDDVWLPQKIEKSLEKIRELESILGATYPLLVYSDLVVVDKELNIIYPSHAERTGAKHCKTLLNYLIVQNMLTGCSVMYNRTLAKLIITEPDFMVMHDWWLALIVSAFGRFGVIEETTILYRQHGNNDTGVNRRNSLEHFFHKLLNFEEVSIALNNTYLQAGSFLKLYSDKLSLDQQNLLSAYASIPLARKPDRIRTLLKYKTLKNGLIRIIAQFIAVWRVK